MSVLTKKKILLDATGVEIIRDELYEALDSFVCGPKAEYSIARRQKLRGSSEPIRHSPSLWVKEGLDDSEFHALRVVANPWC